MVTSDFAASADDHDYSQIARVADRLLTPVAVIAPDSTLRYANGELAGIMGVEVPKLIGKPMIDFVHPDDRERVRGELALITSREADGGFSRLRLNGPDLRGWRIVDVYAHNLIDDPDINGILISGGDVTEEENLARTLKAFSDVTRILIHARDEHELLSAVCDSIIENGEYLVAWVGYARDDEERTVQRVAASGLTSCLEGDLTRWDESEWGRGPTGVAIRTRSAQVINEPRSSPRYDLWSEQMDVFGVRSVCSLPLVIGDDAVGALTIYCRDPRKFAPDEMAVLADYAEELSFGISRLRDTQRLGRSESQLRAAERLAHLGHWEWDLRTDEVTFNADEIHAIYGTDARNWSGTFDAFLSFVPHEDRVDVGEALRQGVVTGSAELTHRITTGAGEIRHLRVRTELERDDRGAPLRVLGASLDVTDAAIAKSRVESSREFLLAITDNMNEGMLATDTEGVITYVNAAASRLLGASGPEMLGSSVARYLCAEPRLHREQREEGAGRFDVWRRGETLHLDLCSAVRHDGSTFPIGLTASPLVAGGIEGSVIVFEDVSAHVVEQRRIEQELEKLTWVGRVRDALDDARFELFAQPVIDLASATIVQHELLIRMRSPTGELVEPARFLDTAEEFGLISEIDRWVIAETARVAALGHRVAFNLSARSVADPQTLERIRTAVRDTGADADLMECEITETALVHDIAAAEGLVKGLIDLGCSVALDDFGVGYGGFAYLKRLPVSVLKIDREFVRDLGEEASSRHVVAAVVSLAKAFGLSTTAEGPETTATLDLLRELGVDRAQGFIIGRPRPLSETFEGY